MTHPSKRKGNTYERELVKEAMEYGFEAVRAYASNGKSLGEDEDVDVLVDEVLRIQAKRTKKIAKKYKPGENVDVVAMREDRGETFFVVPASLFWDMWRHARLHLTPGVDTD